MQGELTIYNKEKRLVLFETNSNLQNKFIFVGGLTDGFLALPYLNYLQETVFKFNYSLVQPLLSISYLGYGNVNLDNDVKELDDLISFLVNKKLKNKKISSYNIILMGHSTGAQDAMYYAKYGKYKNILSGIILQGAVSDREYALYSKGKNILENEIKIARELVSKGKGQYFMPPEVDDAPITANRFLSLNDVDGTDDMFSTDLSNEKLGKVFLDLDFKEGKHKKYVNCPIFLISSGGDEYVPRNIDLLKHTKRMQNLAILKNWSKDKYIEKKKDCELKSDKNKSNYSLDLLKSINLENIFINTESAIEVALFIPNAKHAIEKKIEQDQLMEIIQLLLKKIEN
jgi:pimeloyl-ACP methyl ester carboxylesterase